MTLNEYGRGTEDTIDLIKKRVNNCKKICKDCKKTIQEILDSIDGKLIDMKVESIEIELGLEREC